MPRGQKGDLPSRKRWQPSGTIHQIPLKSGEAVPLLQGQRKPEALWRAGALAIRILLSKKEGLQEVSLRMVSQMIPRFQS